jgi:hypothetical protein
MCEIGCCFSRQSYSLGVAVLSLLALSGCGGGVGQVSGRVTMKGALLPALEQGAVVFTVGDREVAGTIRNDGTYTVLGVPVGAATVKLLNPRPDASRRFTEHAVEEMTKDVKPEDPTSGKWLAKHDPTLKALKRAKAVAKPPPPFVPPIPAKYESTSTSGLTFDVRRGQQTFNIDLKP